MKLGTLRLPALLIALVPLAGCLGAETDVEQGSAGLSRDRVGDARDGVTDERLTDQRVTDRRVSDVPDRFERCTRDWDCRPGDFCLAADGDDRDDRPDAHFCGREPSYACESDRECGDSAECVRGNCYRRGDAGDDPSLCEEFRHMAQRIRNAVREGSIRPARARELWRRLANAVASTDCSGGGDVARDTRDVDARR